MRTAGLCVYMAQIGSYVPCMEATINPVDKILVRMGAGDSQFHGMSTFFAEMLDASRILKNATRNSLVLIDELGRGTSTYDGFGLAWSIARHIASQNKALALFATHFQELTELAGLHKEITNLYCDAIAKGDQFTLLYSIKEGVCKQSFGCAVAKAVGFPGSVIQDAEAHLKKQEDNDEKRKGTSKLMLQIKKRKMQ